MKGLIFIFALATSAIFASCDNIAKKDKASVNADSITVMDSIKTDTVIAVTDTVVNDSVTMD